MAIKQGKYKLAETKWMDRESTGFTKTFLKLPPGVQIYKLKVGKAKLDIIPYVAGKRNPDADEGMLYWKVQFWVHRNVGPNRDTVVCPAKTLDKPCPVCEEYARQMRTNPDDDEYKQIQEMKPREWELIQVRDRNNKEAGIQILPLSFHRFSDKIVEQAAMGEEEQHWDNFWHPKGGKAILVNWGNDSTGERGGSYIRAKGVNFLERPDLPDALIEKGHCLDECLLVYKYDKLKEMFGEGGGEEEEEEEGEEGEEGEESEAPPKKKKKKPAAEEEEGEEESSEEEGEESESEEGEESEGEEEEEETPPKKKKKKPAASEDEESEGEEEEESGEEEEEEAPPKKKKKKPAPEPEEEEGEEESSEEESEEEEEAPAPKKKKKKPAAEPEEDEGEEEGEESEEEEEAPAPKKKKKKGGGEEPSEWDQFDSGEPEEAEGEEEEEEAPPKKKKKK